MQCAEHPSVPAIAICKVCGRGLCAECATDVGGMVVCKHRCEETARMINRMNARQLQTHARVGLHHIVTFVMFLVWSLAGIAMIAGSFMRGTSSDNFSMLLFGVILAGVGIPFAYSYWRWMRAGRSDA